MEKNGGRQTSLARRMGMDLTNLPRRMSDRLLLVNSALGEVRKVYMSSLVRRKGWLSKY